MASRYIKYTVVETLSEVPFRSCHTAAYIYDTFAFSASATILGMSFLILKTPLFLFLMFLCLGDTWDIGQAYFLRFYSIGKHVRCYDDKDERFNLTGFLLLRFFSPVLATRSRESKAYCFITKLFLSVEIIIKYCLERDYFSILRWNTPLKFPNI